MTELSQVISSVGFPIVMCLILMWYVKDLQTTMTQTLNDLKNTINILNEKIEKLEVSNNKGEEE